MHLGCFDENSFESSLGRTPILRSAKTAGISQTAVRTCQHHADEVSDADKKDAAMHKILGPT